MEEKISKPDDEPCQVLFARLEKVDPAIVFYKLCNARFKDGAQTNILIPIVRGPAVRNMLRSFTPANPIAALAPEAKTISPATSIPTNQLIPRIPGSLVFMNQPPALVPPQQTSQIHLPIPPNASIQAVPQGFLIKLPAPGSIVPQAIPPNIMNNTQMKQMAQLASNIPLRFLLTNPVLNQSGIVGWPAQVGLVPNQSPWPAIQKADFVPVGDPTIPEVVIKLGEGSVGLGFDSPEKVRPKTGRKRKIFKSDESEMPGLVKIFRECYVKLKKLDLAYLDDDTVDLSVVSEEQLFGSRRQGSQSLKDPDRLTSECAEVSGDDKLAIELNYNYCPDMSGKFAEMSGDPTRTQIQKLKELLQVKLEAVEKLSKK